MLNLPATSVDKEWNAWCQDKKFAFLSPYQCPFGEPRQDVVNGCTGFPTLFGGADFYYYPDLKDLDKFDFLKQYTHMFINVYPEYFALLAKIKKALPNLIIMGISDIQTHVLSYWNLKDVKLFINSIRLYDYIFSTNMDEVSTFQGCLDNPEHCQFTGWPMYPEITHYPKIVDPSKKDKNLVALGLSNPGDFNRDILTNLAVWKGLKKRFPDLKAFMYYVTPNKKQGLREVIDAYKAQDIELVDELNYHEAISYLSNAYLAIHMYTFKVVGRFAQDCATLGIPLVGTIANLPNRLCFPSISVKDYYVPDAIELATELLMSPYQYSKTREHALRQSHFYDLENTKRRVWEVIRDDNKTLQSVPGPRA